MGGKIGEKRLLKKIKSLENSLDIAGEYSRKLESRLRAAEARRKLLLEEEKKKNEAARKKTLESKEIAIRESLIKNLLAELEALRKRFSKIDEIEAISRDGRIPAIPVEDFEKDMILEKDRIFGINGSIIFFKMCKSNPEAAKTLVFLQPKAVIADLEERDAEILKKAEIAAIGARAVTPIRYGDYLGIRREDIEGALKGVARNEDRFFRIAGNVWREYKELAARRLKVRFINKQNNI